MIFYLFVDGAFCALHDCSSKDEFEYQLTSIDPAKYEDLKQIILQSEIDGRFSVYVDEHEVIDPIKYSFGRAELPNGVSCFRNYGAFCEQMGWGKVSDKQVSYQVHQIVIDMLKQMHDPDFLIAFLKTNEEYCETMWFDEVRSKLAELIRQVKDEPCAEDDY